MRRPDAQPGERGGKARAVRLPDSGGARVIGVGGDGVLVGRGRTVRHARDALDAADRFLVAGERRAHGVQQRRNAADREQRRARCSGRGPAASAKGRPATPVGTGRRGPGSARRAATGARKTAPNGSRAPCARISRREEWGRPSAPSWRNDSRNITAGLAARRRPCIKLWSSCRETLLLPPAGEAVEGVILACETRARDGFAS